LDLAAGADHEAEVGLGGLVEGLMDGVGVERLAEPDGVGAQECAAIAAPGERRLGADVDLVPVLDPGAAEGAAHVEDGPVQLEGESWCGWSVTGDRHCGDAV